MRRNTPPKMLRIPGRPPRPPATLRVATRSHVGARASSEAEAGRRAARYHGRHHTSPERPAVKQVFVQKITHSYDGVRPAVSELSFHIEAGEVLALIGPNGAGKSTSLRILATLQRPDSGAVLWDGRDAGAERPAVRQRIGFLGDGTALYPNMTAAGYLRFFAECYGMSDGEAKTRVAELLEVFKLSSKAEALISDLSKGMRQRLAI